MALRGERKLSKYEKIDEKGEKIQCKICGYFYHRLEVHLKKKHSMSLEEYLEEYPGEPTMSESAKKKASKSAKKRGKVDKTNDYEVLGVDTGKIKDYSKLSVGLANLEVVRNDELGDFEKIYVPVNDEQWMPGATEYKSMEEIAVGVEDEDHIFIYGPPGAGKTTLIKQLGAMSNTPVIIFNIIEGVLPEDFLGSLKLVTDSDGNSVTEWVDGTFTKFWSIGSYVVFDEITAAPPNLMMRLHSILDSGDIILFEDGGRIIPKHPRTRFFATDNTNGRGDDSGMFAGTHILNEATLDRFNTVVKYSYTDPNNEKMILKAKGGVELKIARDMVKVAQKVRESFEKELCYCTLSTRRLIDWARKTVRYGDVRRASEVTILNKLGKEDCVFVNSIIQRHFGGAP